jgi:outer membrane protein W
MTPSRSALIRTGLLLLPALAPALAQAQAFSYAQTDNPWTFTTHLVMTGSSDESKSDPQGYKVYSAFTLDAAVQRRLGTKLAVEMSVRTESREVSLIGSANDEAAIGSIEALPISLLLQYRPEMGETVRPYVGVGLNLTVVWEKSGGLDSTDLSPSVAPAVQVGADFRLSSRLFLNVDLKWNPWRTDIKGNGSTLAHLQIDPLALGVGVGFRF